MKNVKKINISGFSLTIEGPCTPKIAAALSKKFGSNKPITFVQIGEILDEILLEQRTEAGSDAELDFAD